MYLEEPDISAADFRKSLGEPTKDLIRGNRELRAERRARSEATPATSVAGSAQPGSADGWPAWTDLERWTIVDAGEHVEPTAADRDWWSRFAGLMSSLD